MLKSWESCLTHVLARLEYVVGRTQDPPPCDHFVPLGTAANKKISRRLATLVVDGESGELRLRRLAGTKTRVRLDGAAAEAGGAALVSPALQRPGGGGADDDHKVATIHFGDESRHAVTGQLDGQPDFRLYVVAAREDRATGAAYFALPPYESRDFDERGATSDDPILLDDASDLVGPALAGPRRKARLADELGDDELCEATRHAAEREAAKRRRLEARRHIQETLEDDLLKRAAVSAGDTAPPAPPLPPEDDDDYDDLGDVAIVALTDDAEAPEKRVLVPKYLGYRLKDHQVEAAKFLFDQTVESLDLLAKDDGEKTSGTDSSDDPFGCVLAHSMGLGKSLTCIAYVAALFRNPVARTKIRTCLVVCPTNVVRNWSGEFGKWCGRDQHLVRRVVVLDNKVKGDEARLGALRKWQDLGGVAIVGYDFFHALVGARKTDGEADGKGAKSTKKRRRKKMDLQQLLEAGALEAGSGCVSVEGREGDVEADLLSDGTIQLDGAHFPSASAFAKHVLRVDKVNGYAKVTYRGETLAALRDRASDDVLDQDDGDGDGDGGAAQGDAAAGGGDAAADAAVAEFRRLLQDPGPDVVILDEAHTIKNPASKRHAALSRIRTRRRVALTGTPLQNNLLEYHTMISYVRGAVLGTRAEFKNRFSEPIANGLCRDSVPRDVQRMKKRMFVLQDLIKAFVLRRDESVLAREMGKTEYLVTTKLQDVQRQLYGAFLADRRRSGAKVNVMSAHQPILKLGNHPMTHLLVHADGTRKAVDAALADSDQARLDRALAAGPGGPGGPGGHEGPGGPGGHESAAAAAWCWRDVAGDALSRAGSAAEIAHSAKTVVLFELLSECLRRKDRMVVFTQSLPTLDFVEHALKSETWGGLLDASRDVVADAVAHGGARRGGWRPGRDYFRIEGSVSGEQRQRMVDAFEREGATAKVFLLSTKAGNMGINLVAANRVVLLDASWNPAIDRQALFRCFRYGQTKHVFIYRLVAQGFEQRVYTRANQKEFLALKVVDDAALERLYDFADLGDVARLDDASEGEGDDDASSSEASDAGAGAQQPKANNNDHVEDAALRAVLSRRGALVASTVVTDDLMRENEDERLDAGLRDDAMDEYEREKAGRPSREEEQRRDAAIRAEELRRQRAAEDANRAHLAREELAKRKREALESLPPGWAVFHRDLDKRPYYHHAASNKTVWKHPGGWTGGHPKAAASQRAPAPAPSPAAAAAAATAPSSAGVARARQKLVLEDVFQHLDDDVRIQFRDLVQLAKKKRDQGEIPSLSAFLMKEASAVVGVDAWNRACAKHGPAPQRAPAPAPAPTPSAPTPASERSPAAL